VTRGAQPAGDAARPLSIAQAALWGLGRVAAEEHPDLWGGLLDLDPAAGPESSAEILARELRRTPLVGELAFRGGTGVVPRLVSHPLPSTSSAPFRRDATYLVTGGLGGLGLAVARWMAERGARRIVLLGRHGLPARDEWTGDGLAAVSRRRVDAVRELERLGVAVHVETADVGDEASLAAFTEGYRRGGWPPIRGVVHCAGAIQDRLLAELDLDALEAPFHGKARGAELVDRQLADADLDFLVLFSSVGALWGQPGQGGYAAANAFMDALAHERRRSGRVALSVNWPVWNGLGFADTEGGRRVLDELLRRGVRGLSAAAGLDLLGRILGSSEAQLAVLPADWTRVRAQATRLPAVVTDLAAAPAVEAPSAGASSVREEIEALPVGERRERLEAHLQQQLAAVLKLRPERIERLRPVRAFGLDSLMALELRKRLETSLALPLSATLVWNHPTVAAMATHLAARLGLPLEPSHPQSAAPVGLPSAPGPDIADVAKLSEEEALRALMGGETAQ
jgi:NAD(P)-dependent dehydrogenase (short-subunit alcohol dehydrogenase family)/acyl carrier protein